MRRRWVLSALFPFFLAACGTPDAALPTPGEPAVTEAPLDYAQDELVFAPDAATAQALFAPGAVSFAPPEPFQQVELLLEADTAPGLTYRALVGVE